MNVLDSQRSRCKPFGSRLSRSSIQGASGALLLSLALAGCKAPNAEVDDQKLAASVQAQLNGDSALAGQSIQPSSQRGVVTLNGTVANDAERTIAARDAAGVAGVKEVINQITLGSPQAPNANAAVNTPNPAPLPTPIVPAQGGGLTPAQQTLRDRQAQQRADAAARRQAQQQQAEQRASQAAADRAPVPYPNTAQQAPAGPVFRTVTLPAGSTVAVRVTQTLDSESTQAGSTFSGVVASDVLADGLVALPAGSPVSGLVTDVKDATHFRGSSSLTLALSTISRRGERLGVSSDPYTVTGKARGVNTAEKVGGGAAVGAILGGIFGGGKGAAIGAAAGGGTGAGVNAITRGQQVQIPSETVVRFHLTAPVTVRARADGGGGRDNVEPTLQHHSQ